MTDVLLEDAQTTDLTPDTEHTYFTSGTALKALGDGRVGGYLVVFGSPQQRDLQGEYFTPQTDFALHMYDRRPALYHHGLDGTLKGMVAGYIDVLKADDIGLWAEAQLDLHNRYVQTVNQLVNKGILGWSSGALPQLVEVEGDGKIKTWPIVEGSLTPAPAEPRRTTIQSIKSAMTALENSLITSEEPTAKGITQATWQSALNLLKQSMTEIRGAKMMDLQGLLAALADANIDPEQQIQIIGTMSSGDGADGAEPPPPPAPDEGMMADDPIPVEEEEEDPMKTEPNGAAKAWTPEQLAKVIELSVKASVEQAMKTAPATETLPGAQNTPPGAQPGKSSIQVTTKYDRMPLEDLTFLKSVMDAASRAQGYGPNWSPANEADARSFWGNLADKAIKAQNEGRVQFNERAVKSLNAYKANELNYSTLATGGDEFVWEGWSNQLWRKPRIDNVVSANMNWIDMPSNPYKLPIESTDPTVVAVPETTNEDQLTLDNSSSPIADSKIGTSNTTATARKLGLRVGVSEELNEDSIIPIASLWREQAVRAMEDARDFVILNADDTNSSSNINTDGSPAATDKFLYGGGDGILHLPLVTNPTGLTVNAAGADITLSMMREARAKLNRAMIHKLQDLVWFVDPLVAVKMLGIDEFLNASINGRQSTAETGEILRVDNVPVFVSNEIYASATSGKVSATAGNNVRGRAVLVHKPSWYPCRRREIRTTFDYMAVYDAWQLVITLRMALVRRSDDCAALIFNLAI